MYIISILVVFNTVTSNQTAYWTFGLTYIVYTRGLSSEPCGTPVVIGLDGDVD